MGRISWPRKSKRSERIEKQSRIEKTEEIYLHESWFDHFQDELSRWTERRSDPRER